MGHETTAALTLENVATIYHQPLPFLLAQAHNAHLESFDPLRIQASQLLSIKTGGCPENCSYCPQSAHYRTGVNKTALMPTQNVLQAAQNAKKSGAERFCMGAAWRQVNDGPDFDRVVEMVREISALGLETCCTLGMLNEAQARRLKDAGLRFYNHNIDSSRAHYEKIISTRGYDDRLRTIEHVRRAGLSVCTGGIIGMGESDEDRISFLHQLAILTPMPESVTINALVPSPGTPLAERPQVSALELVRVIGTARILMPKSIIRLSAGRMTLSEEGQFLCFYAGANSVFVGDRLLTSPNPSVSRDQELARRTGIQIGVANSDLANFAPAKVNPPVVDHGTHNASRGEP